MATYHSCQFPDCEKKVKTRFWACYEHYNSMPSSLRFRLQFHYLFGKEPTAEYTKVLEEFEQWLLENPHKRGAKK